MRWPTPIASCRTPPIRSPPIRRRRSSPTRWPPEQPVLATPAPLPGGYGGAGPDRRCATRRPCRCAPPRHYGRIRRPEAAASRRAFFKAELTTQVNSVRALDAIQAALSKNGPVPADIFRLLEHIDEQMPGQLPRACTDLTKARCTSPRVGKLRNLNDNPNLVIFWKQKRLRHFWTASGHAAQAIRRHAAYRQNSAYRRPHIDRSAQCGRLPNRGRSLDQGRLIAANTIARHLRTSATTIGSVDGRLSIVERKTHFWAVNCLTFSRFRMPLKAGCASST